MVLGIDGLDQDPPELRTGNQKQYDPFLLDIYILGNVYKKKIVQVLEKNSFTAQVLT